jgi:hypothetical protein
MKGHRLRVFKNSLLRIFLPKRDKVTGYWRKKCTIRSSKMLLGCSEEGE